MHEVVEASAILEKIVDSTQDAEDTEGEDPDTNDCDNGCALFWSMFEESEDGEHGGKNINKQNRTGKLP